MNQPQQQNFSNPALQSVWDHRYKIGFSILLFYITYDRYFGPERMQPQNVVPTQQSPVAEWQRQGGGMQQFAVPPGGAQRPSSLYRDVEEAEVFSGPDNWSNLPKDPNFDL